MAKNRALITGGSTLNNIQESRLSKKYNVKIRAFPEADKYKLYVRKTQYFVNK